MKKNFLPSKKAVFFSYALLLILIAVLPLNGPGSGMNDIYVVTLRLDYLLHGLVFLPLIFLYRNAFPASFNPFHFSLFIFHFSLLLLFAAFCEIIQFPLTYRTFNINDLLANMTGVLLGLPALLFPNR